MGRQIKVVTDELLEYLKNSQRSFSKNVYRSVDSVILNQYTISRWPKPADAYRTHPWTDASKKQWKIINATPKI